MILLCNPFSVNKILRWCLSEELSHNIGERLRSTGCLKQLFAYFFILKPKDVSETLDVIIFLAQDMNVVESTDTFWFSFCLVSTVEHSWSIFSSWKHFFPQLQWCNMTLVNLFLVSCHLLLHLSHTGISQNILLFLFLFSPVEVLCQHLSFVLPPLSSPMCKALS